MRKKHFLIYYDNRIREFVKTIPRTWAKANKEHFPAYTFTTKDHPTDDEIEPYLVNNYGFFRKVENDYVVLFNFSQNIPPHNGLSFIL